MRRLVAMISCRPSRAQVCSALTQGSAFGSTLGYIPAAASRLPTPTFSQPLTVTARFGVSGFGSMLPCHFADKFVDLIQRFG